MRSILIYLSLPLLLAGCGMKDWYHGSWPYRINVDQGNVITQKAVDQLQVGMTKRQVVFVMGTPLVVDPFHLNQWDYIYTIQISRDPLAKRQITLTFEGEQLVEIQGDLAPEYATTMDEAEQLNQEFDADLRKVKARQKL